MSVHSLEIWRQLLTIQLVALALALDAFSIAVGLGMRPMRLRMIAYISMTIGLFHLLMPLVGIMIGKFLSLMVGEVARWLGGALLIYLGVQMVWQALFSKEESDWLSIRGTGLLLFAFSVSLDALSAGISFGLFTDHLFFTVASFGGTAMFLTALGLWMGRRIGRFMGGYNEVIGGLFLFFFGLRVLFL